MVMRTHNCSVINSEHIGSKVCVAGHVLAKRNLGKIIFLDIADSTGSIQLCGSKTKSAELFDKMASITIGSSLSVEGMVKDGAPQSGASNKRRLELEVLYINHLSPSNPIPALNKFSTSEQVSSEAPMRYRYLELRGDSQLMQSLKGRGKILSILRSILDRKGFLEVETPILTSSSPEGARDYLVPSRVHKGRCYALPQSPQLFKQILMVGGLDRYYQVARCFRDEDLRQDRQPEFTQLDVELSFSTSNEIRGLAEGMLVELWNEFLGIDLGRFPVLSYKDAMEQYGSDKPDLRLDSKLVDLKDLCSAILDVYSLSGSSPVWKCVGLLVSGHFQEEDLESLCWSSRCTGVLEPLWLRYESIESSHRLRMVVAGDEAKRHMINDDLSCKLLSIFQPKIGDYICIGLTNSSRQELLTELGKIRANLISRTEGLSRQFRPLWVVDFPMFELSDSGRLTSVHHPFTAPKHYSGSIEGLGDPAHWVADSYDIVLNGYELGGGSVRISDPLLQRHVFEVLGLDHESMGRDFGHLLEALSYGAPPHGGFAIGLDRLAMLILGLGRIRDVIAFPKSTAAACALTGAPNTPSVSALEEIGVKFMTPLMR